MLNSESWFQLLTRFVSQQYNSIGICVWSATNSLGSCQLVGKYFKMADVYIQNVPSFTVLSYFWLTSISNVSVC